MKCQICGEEATIGDYCELHETALRNLQEKYDAWRKALGLTWVEYLEEIVGNSLTGEKAREVAEGLLAMGK